MAPERRSWDTETMEAETLMAQCNPQWKTLGKQIGNHWVQPNPSHHAWFRLKSTKVRIQSRWDRDQKLAQFSENLNGFHSGFFPTGSSSLFYIRDWGDHILLLHALILKLLPFGHPILQENCHKRNKLHWRIGPLVNLIETRWWIQKSSEIDQNCTSHQTCDFERCQCLSKVWPDPPSEAFLVYLWNMVMYLE